MKKLITFSLWGTNPKYLVGAIKNAQLAKEIYPGWICRFYIAQSVPFSISYQLENMDNVEVVRKEVFGDWKGFFWRYEPSSESDIDVMISRDTDSRLSLREKAAVDEWIKSDKGFHIMRDHPWHQYPILGGMWGVKNNIIPNMKDLIDNFSQENEYTTDYKFFAREIIPIIKNDVLIHDEFFGGSPFPTPRKQYEFVGQVFDENEETIEEHLEILKRHVTLRNVKYENSKELILITHLGLGDCIECNGMVRYYAEIYDKVNIFAKEQYYSMVEQMYEDDDSIIVNKVVGNESQCFIKFIEQKENTDVLIPGFNYYHKNIEMFKQQSMGPAEAFYFLANVPWKMRVEKFYFKRNLSKEKSVLKKLNPNNEKYIFVHDDPDRGYSIDVDSKYKIIRNDKSLSLLDMVTLFENAEEIHCMSSSVLCLIDCLSLKVKFPPLFLHHDVRNVELGPNGLFADWNLLKNV